MGNGQSSYKTTVIAAVVVLCLLGVAAAYGLTEAGGNSDTTPLVTSVLGFLGSAIVGLLALARTDKVNKHLNGKLDQLVEDKVEQADDAGRPLGRDVEPQRSSSSSSRR